MYPTNRYLLQAGSSIITDICMVWLFCTLISLVRVEQPHNYASIIPRNLSACCDSEVQQSQVVSRSIQFHFRQMPRQSTVYLSSSLLGNRLQVKCPHIVLKILFLGCYSYFSTQRQPFCAPSLKQCS